MDFDSNISTKEGGTNDIPNIVSINDHPNAGSPTAPPQERVVKDKMDRYNTIPTTPE